MASIKAKRAKFNPSETARAIRTDAAIVAGEEVGPSDASWQDVAATLAVNLRAMAVWFDGVRTGEYSSEAGEVALVAAILNGSED